MAITVSMVVPSAPNLCRELSSIAVIHYLMFKRHSIYIARHLISIQIGYGQTQCHVLSLKKRGQSQKMSLLGRCRHRNSSPQFCSNREQHEPLLAQTRFTEVSTAEKPSITEPTPVQPFTKTDAVEDPIVTLVPSDVPSATQSSSERGRPMWDEASHLSDDNANSYETNFALDSIITFSKRH